MRNMLMLLGFLAATATVAQAQIAVEQPWSRATAPSATTGAAFMTLVNKSATASDRLIGAESPAARTVELHNHTMDGDVMRMRKTDTVDVKPGETVVLQPMGLHVMLLGLTGPLKDGEHLPLTLVFEKAGRVELKVPIAKAGAAMPAMGHQHMQHGPTKTN